MKYVLFAVLVACYSIHSHAGMTCAEEKLQKAIERNGSFSAGDHSFAFPNWSNHVLTFTANCWGWSSLQRKFYYLATFVPDLPAPTAMEMDYLIQVIKSGHTAVIPGYANLYRASSAHPALFQKHIHREWIEHVIEGVPHVGHTLGAQLDRSKAEVARALVESVDSGVMPLVGLFRQVVLNHVIMVVSYREYDDGSITFWVSDPNEPYSLKPFLYEPAGGKGSFVFPSSFFDGPDITVALMSGWGEIIHSFDRECQDETTGF